MTEELARLEHEWMEAVRARDLATLDRVLAPEFTLTTGRPGAEVRSRAEYVRITRDEYRVENFAFDDLRVEAYGDAAVVHSRYRQVARLGDADRTQSFRMTDVWIRRDGRWQAVARHATPLEPDDSPRAVVQAWFDAFARDEHDAARPLLADDGVVHAPDRELHGFDDAVAWFERRRGLAPDFSYRLDELLGGQGHAVALVTLSSAGAAWRQVAVYRVENGQIVEVWLHEEALPRR